MASRSENYRDRDTSISLTQYLIPFSTKLCIHVTSLTRVLLFCRNHSHSVFLWRPVRMENYLVQLLAAPYQLAAEWSTSILVGLTGCLLWSCAASASRQIRKELSGIAFLSANTPSAVNLEYIVNFISISRKLKLQSNTGCATYIAILLINILVNVSSAHQVIYPT